VMTGQIFGKFFCKEHSDFLKFIVEINNLNEL